MAPTHIPWRTLLLQVGNAEAVRRLLGTGAFGNDLPRSAGAPEARRILVLAAHQDDELIGAGGTLLFCAKAGAQFRVVYSTDGSTSYGSFAETDVTNFRHREATRVWKKLADVEPVFWDYPNRCHEIGPDAGARLAEIIRDFAPDVIFLPSFLEQPLEHRRLNDILLAAEALAPLPKGCRIWGYQITTRASGSAVVDITAVAKEKRRINQLWRSQNAYRDYARLAAGRDIAASYYLKGSKSKPLAPFAETFIAFPASEYLQLARSFIGLPVVSAPAVMGGRRIPPPDFFIVGMQKSGSYWLTALLDAHPLIRCFPSRPGLADGTGEAHLFDLLARAETDFQSFARSMRSKLDGTFTDIVPKSAPQAEDEKWALFERFRDRFDEYCHLQRLRHAKPLVGEKTTESVHHLDILQRLYPNALKIAVLRDPRDRCVSFHFHQMRKGRLTAETELNDGFVDSYIDRVTADYEGLLQVEGAVHVLTYEDMSANPIGVSQRILRAIGLPEDAETAQAMVDAAAFERLAGRETGQMDATSHFRRGIVGDWRERLSSAQSQRIVDELHSLTCRIERRFDLELRVYRSGSTTERGASTEQQHSDYTLLS